MNLGKIPIKTDKNLFQDSIIGTLTGNETEGAAIGAVEGAVVEAVVGVGIELTRSEVETADVIRIGRLAVVV